MYVPLIMLEHLMLMNVCIVEAGLIVLVSGHFDCGHTEKGVPGEPPSPLCGFPAENAFLTRTGTVL